MIQNEEGHESTGNPMLELAKSLGWVTLSEWCWDVECGIRADSDLSKHMGAQNWLEKYHSDDLSKLMYSPVQYLIDYSGIGGIEESATYTGDIQGLLREVDWIEGRGGYSVTVTDQETGETVYEDCKLLAGLELPKP
jgi:hypothetical protein